MLSSTLHIPSFSDYLWYKSNELKTNKTFHLNLFSKRTKKKTYYMKYAIRALIFPTFNDFPRITRINIIIGIFIIR